jgi:hypothetical protein
MTPAERQLQIRNIVVEHDRFREASEGLAEFHYPVRGGLPSQGCVSVLVGDSRTGKTFATKRYAKEFPPTVGESSMIRPVAYVDMPMEGGGGPRAILESIANALQLPFSLRVTNPALMNVIMRSLVDQKVELLLLDEFEQVFRENDKRLLGFGRGLIRKLLDLGTLSVVCIGLMPTYYLMQQDPQLTGRGGLPYRILRTYSWDNVEERSAFRLLCDEFDACLPFDERSNLGKSKDLAYRLYMATEGNIGRLKSLIEAAGAIAINEDTGCIEQHHFAAAHEHRKLPGSTFNWFIDNPADAPKTKRVPVLKAGPASVAFSKRKPQDLSNGL